jgi:hypothetical protein
MTANRLYFVKDGANVTRGSEIKNRFLRERLYLVNPFLRPVCP